MDYYLGLSLNKTINILKFVKARRPFLGEKRKAVCNYLNVDEVNTWGKNLLIFGNVAISKRRSGHKHRYLPLIDDKNKFAKKNALKLTPMRTDFK